MNSRARMIQVSRFTRILLRMESKMAGPDDGSIVGNAMPCIGDTVRMMTEGIR